MLSLKFQISHYNCVFGRSQHISCAYVQWSSEKWTSCCL